MILCSKINEGIEISKETIVTNLKKHHLDTHAYFLSDKELESSFCSSLMIVKLARARARLNISVIRSVLQRIISSIELLSSSTVSIMFQIIILEITIIISKAFPTLSC